MIDINICPICEGKVFIPFLTCLDHSITFEKFNLVKCKGCELVITNPRPSDETIGNYYLSNSYTSHIASAKNGIDKIYIMARNFTLKWKLSLVEFHTSTSNNKNILDFGCGTGEFLKEAKLKSWYTSGVEPSQNARERASDLIAKDISPSLDLLANKKKFDAITLWHVLEHVPDLHDTIKKLTSRLNQDGTIFIAVPNHTSWDAGHYKQYWAGYDAPRHLWHFSEKNIKMLLQKNDLKLAEIIPMRLDAYYVCLLSEKYLKKGMITTSGILNSIFNGLRSNFYAKKDKQYSSLIYIVKK